jgi:hypothetical protein
MKGVKEFLFISIVGMLTATSPQAAQPLALYPHQRLAKFIERLKNEPDSVERSESSFDLIHYVRAGKKTPFTDAEIDNIASLLSDDDDAVRAWAAASLGMIGPRAKRAEPQLQMALRRRACPLHFEPNKNMQQTSVNYIRSAMERIGIEPAPLKCDPANEPNSSSPQSTTGLKR